MNTAGIPDGIIFGTTLVGEATPGITAMVSSEDEFAPGGILVSPSLTVTQFQVVIRSRAVLCSEGGRTGHLPSICRARGIPIILIESDALRGLTPGMLVRADPTRGTVAILDEEPRHDSETLPEPLAQLIPPGLPTLEAVISGATDIARINASGMRSHVDSFFMREEFLWTARGMSPFDALRLYGVSAVASMVRKDIEAMESLLQDQRLTFRLLDLRSDDAAAMAAQDTATLPEPNPELGLHGARRIIQEVAYLAAARVLIETVDRDHITLSIPFLNDERELDEVFGALKVTDPSAWGVFVETPAAAHRLPQMLDRGISVVNVGTKDLVQFMLAADRGNRTVARWYDTRHPSVMSTLSGIVTSCDSYDVQLRVYVLGTDLGYYCSCLPQGTHFMMCADELMHLSGPKG